MDWIDWRGEWEGGERKGVEWEWVWEWEWCHGLIEERNRMTWDTQSTVNNCGVENENRGVGGKKFILRDVLMKWIAFHLLFLFFLSIYILFSFVSACDLCSLVYCCTKSCTDIANIQSVYHDTYVQEHYEVHKSPCHDYEKSSKRNRSRRLCEFSCPDVSIKITLYLLIICAIIVIIITVTATSPFLYQGHRIGGEEVLVVTVLYVRSRVL